MTTISFPGLGIGEFELSNIALSLGESFSVYWKGIFIAAAIILGFVCAWLFSKREGVKFDDLIDLTLFTLIFSVIGARIFYGLSTGVSFNGFVDAISVWDGRLSMYGGMITGAITIAVICRLKSLPVLKSFDFAAPALMLAQGFGVYGDFLDGSGYGIPVAEDSALYFLRMGITPHVFEDISEMAYVHPIFLYELFWNFFGLVVIVLIYKNKKFDGQITLAYLAWYGLGKTLIEGLCADSLYIGVFRSAQVIGLISFVACTLTLIYKLSKLYRKQKDNEEYVPAYKKKSNPAFIFEKTEEEPDYTPSFNFGKKDDEDDEDEETYEETEENKENDNKETAEDGEEE